MGFLTAAEIGSLRISRMILHVVGTKPFVPEKERDVQYPQFFIDRILDTDVAPVFSFDEASPTRTCLESIASGTDDFEAGAQALSRRFSEAHRVQSIEGAFFIFELLVEDAATRLYSLIKYDYREAIEQTNGGAGSRLRRIIHAFIADRKAIQKGALVRVVEGVAEHAISALDRIRPPPEIGTYFSEFLGVSRTRNDEELSRDVVEVVRKTLADSQKLLPNEDVPLAFRQAKSVLRERQAIDEEAIKEAILAAAGHPVDEKTRAKLQSATLHKVRSAQLEGLAFPPDRQVFGQPPMRQIRTTENVTLLYPDRLDDKTVQREPRRGGGEVITIQTEKVTEDRVVRDSTGRAARPAPRARQGLSERGPSGRHGLEPGASRH